MYEKDAAITGWINGWAGLSPAADNLMIWISTIGVPLMVLAVAVQWWLPRRDLPTRHVLVASGLTFLIGLGINQLVLLFIQRARPYEAHVSRLIIEPTADFSFPSDHATASFAIAAAFLLLGQRGRGAAFLAAAIVMVIGLITFWFTKKHLGPIGDSPLKDAAPSSRRMKELAVYALSLITIPFILIMVQNTKYTDYFMYTIGPLAFIYFLYETIKLKDSKLQKKLFAAMIFIIFYIIFNAFFEQSGGSLSLFAEKNLTHTLLFFKIDPNIVNNSSNSFFVIVFSSLVGLAWLWMSKKKIEPNTVVKFGIGFLFLAGAFFLFYYTRFFADANGITSLNIFTLAYLVITFGELCLGPIGMSIITKLSPKKLTGMMMGLWFLASAYGQYAAGIFGKEMSIERKDATLLEKLFAYTEGYKQLAIYALIAGVVLIVISPLVRKLMQGVK